MQPPVTFIPPVAAPLALLDYFMLLDTVVNMEYRLAKLKEFSIHST